MKDGKIGFIASVDEESIGNINGIAQNLKNMGCKIDNILTFSGVITGSTSSEVSLNDLKIDGIKNIEADRAVKAFR